MWGNPPNAAGLGHQGPGDTSTRGGQEGSHQRISAELRTLRMQDSLRANNSRRHGFSSTHSRGTHRRHQLGGVITQIAVHGSSPTLRYQCDNVEEYWMESP